MRALAGFFALFVGAFVALNALGGVVSGIWLAVLGEWRALWLGFLGAITSHFALAILLLPCVPFGLAAAAAAERKARIAFCGLSLLSSLYVAALMTAWCLWIMGVFTKRADAHSWVPMLLWSYGVAMAPWAYMASKEAQGGGGDASASTVFFGQVAYVTVMLMVAFGRPTFLSAATTFATIMLIGAVVQLGLGIAATSHLFDSDV